MDLEFHNKKTMFCKSVPNIKSQYENKPNRDLGLWHPDNIPRVEGDSAGNRLGLLVEEQRTNRVTRSESCDNSEWTKVEGSITADAITAPDGTSTADFFVPSTNNANNHLVRDSINVSSAQHSWSVFAKAGGYNWIRLIHGDGDDVDHAAFFDISNGIVGAVSASATASIVDVGNGWYRCSVTVSAAASASSTQNQFIYVAEGDGDVTFAGDGTSGIYIWGAQLEAGSFPTSYIKSNSGSTTSRSADVASIPVADFGYNQSEGSVVVEFQVDRDVDVGGTGIFMLTESQGSTAEVTRLYLRSIATLGYTNRTNGANDVDMTISGGAVNPNELTKVGVAYKENDFAAVRGGGTMTTDQTGSPATHKYLELRNAEYLNGHIKSIKYYPRRLSNAQLQALTSQEEIS